MIGIRGDKVEGNKASSKESIKNLYDYRHDCYSNDSFYSCIAIMGSGSERYILRIGNSDSSMYRCSVTRIIQNIFQETDRIMPIQWANPIKWEYHSFDGYQSDYDQRVLSTCYRDIASQKENRSNGFGV